MEHGLGKLLGGRDHLASDEPEALLPSPTGYKLVDPDKGKMLVAITDKDGGIKIQEIDIGDKVAFLDEKGKPITIRSGCMPFSRTPSNVM